MNKKIYEVFALILIIGLVFVLVGSIAAEAIPVTSNFLSGDSSIDMTMGTGAGKTDKPRWEGTDGKGTGDKEIPAKWGEYDKTLTQQLSLDQLKAYPNEAKQLWNSNKLSEAQQSAYLKKYGINIQNTQGSKLFDDGGKEVLVMRNKVPVNLDTLKNSNFNLAIEGNYVKVSDSSGKFKFLTNSGQLLGPEGVPQDAKPFAPSGGAYESAAPSGGGAAPSGGGVFDQALNIMQQIASLMQNLLGGLKEVLSSNGKGQTKVTQNGDEKDISLEGGAQLAIQNLGERDENGNPKEVRLAQTDEDKKAEFTVDKALNARLKGNNIFTIPKVASVITEPSTPETTVINRPFKDNPAPITGAVIVEASPTGQFAKFIQQDIQLSGEKFSVHIYKSFNEVDVNGNRLRIKDGETIIEFYENNTYYPREIKHTPYFMNKLTNEKDEGRYFRLLEDGQDGSYLIDGEKRGSVGDNVVEHPEIAGIYIAKSREYMIRKGLGLI